MLVILDPGSIPGAHAELTTLTPVPGSIPGAYTEATTLTPAPGSIPEVTILTPVPGDDFMLSS